MDALPIVLLLRSRALEAALGAPCQAFDAVTHTASYEVPEAVVQRAVQRNAAELLAALHEHHQLESLPPEARGAATARLATLLSAVSARCSLLRSLLPPSGATGRSAVVTATKADLAALFLPEELPPALREVLYP
jgi:hypothetical protein